MSYDPAGPHEYRPVRGRLCLLPADESPVERARHDANAFVSFSFADASGQMLRQAPFHYELQRFLSVHRRALIELPRDHGKSTQVCARAVWELGNNKGLRIKIVCATDEIAAERGRFIRDAIAANLAVTQVFPSLRRGEPWTDTRFSVERPGNVIGPSVTTAGIGAGLTGTRADLLICDDIVDVKSLVSRAERERVKAFFRDNLMNLLEPDGRCWCLFTPWHRDDLNAHLKRNQAFETFTKSIDADFTPLWSDRWPRERLRERKNEIGAASFARGYRLVPLTEETAPIQASWIQFWSDEAPLDRTILAIDPAVSAHADADASALVVLGARHGSFEHLGSTDRINEIRCLDAIGCRTRLPQLIDRIDALDRRWDPQVILFESNAAFAGIRDLLTRHARFGPKIKAIVQSKSKAMRVEAFSVPVQNGTFRLKGNSESVDPGQQALFDEMTTFPVAEHDDLLDAAAMGTEYLLNSREPRVW